MRIERLDAPTCIGGENPIWDSSTQTLLYIDNSGRKVHSFAPATGASRTLEMPAVITTLLLREAGGAVVTLRSGIFFLDLGTGSLEPIHPLTDPAPHVFNDGAVDGRGRAILGASTPHSANPGTEGGLFRLDRDLSLHRLDSGIHFSNGPCWAPDGRTFYFSDSWINTVYAYDYDIEAGTVSGKRTFADTSELGGLPDGATVDADGLYWAAIFRSGKVVAYRPDGKLERVIDLPVKLVSSVAFGGAALDQLYVTTMARASTEVDQSGWGLQAGSLFVIEGAGARGRPEYRFAR